MSVVQSKRGEGQLLVFTKASELATYTIRICSNEKNFPKHYRWCLTSKIVDAAIEIANNAILVTRNTKDFKYIEQISALMLENWFKAS